MSTTVDLALQFVNGDPFVTGNNINITTSILEAAVANEDGAVSLSSVAAGDTITVGGLEYTYEYLGTGNVDGDPTLPAAFIRIVEPLPAGATLSAGDTFAIDLTGQPGDPDYPNLPNGNTKLQVTDLDTTTPVQFPGFVCFVRGTHIMTPKGEVRIEDLRPGDLVTTLDHGPQPIRLIVSKELRFTDERVSEDHKPIEFKPGSLGDQRPTRKLSVSPQHRMLVRKGEEEVLVPAKALVTQPGVRAKKGCRKTEYFHLIFDRHEVVLAEGAPSESFFPGQQAVSVLEKATLAELRTIFPDLAYPVKPGLYRTARPVIQPSRARRMIQKSELVA